MEKKGLLIVSFGSSHLEAVRRDIQPMEAALEAGFPDYVTQKAFASGVIRRKLLQRDGLVIPSVRSALESLQQQGVQELLVQPTFLLRGREYDALIEEIAGVQDRFAQIRMGNPLLSDQEDLDALAAGLAKAYPRERGALLLMGHGTDHEADRVYDALETALGQEHIFLATVEGKRTLEDVLPRLLEQGVKRVTLAPLMLVAGDHAQNDMASSRPDSWKSRLEGAGIQADCRLQGLGSLGFVQERFLHHAMQAFGKN